MIGQFKAKEKYKFAALRAEKKVHKNVKIYFLLREFIS
jgi:hypothetical protein